MGDRIDLLNSITCPVIHMFIRVWALYFSFACSLSRLYVLHLPSVYISIACIGCPLYKYVFFTNIGVGTCFLERLVFSLILGTLDDKVLGNLH